jgi:hypothetical protein
MVEVTKTHVFDAPIEKVWAMFRDPASHLAKFEAMGHRDIEVVSQETTDDRFRIELKRLVDLELPGFAKKVLKPTNTVISVDTWNDHGDGTYGGTFELQAPGTPMETSGTTLIRPEGKKTTHYEVTIAVKVKVPLVGGKIENYAKGAVIEPQLETEFRLGDEWLKAH